MTTAHKFKLPITSEGALREFVELCFGACIPDQVVVEGHSTPWRAFCDAYFAKSPVVVWVGSRGFAGKSYLLALLSTVEALTQKADVSILGGSFEQAKRIQDYITQFYRAQNSPKHLWEGEPLTTLHRFVWGNTVNALTASQKSIRGPHAPKLRGDEVDEMSIDLLDAALGQPMSVVENGKVVIKAQTVLSSTHHKADGVMTEVLKRANKHGWPVHYWGYQETSAEGGWLLPSEVENKRTVIPAQMWKVEYDLNEPSPEGRAIMPEKVEQMFDPKLGTFEGRNGEYIEIEPPMLVCPVCGWEIIAADATHKKCAVCKSKLRNARYATGADWAKKQDHTVIVTIRYDVSPWRLVAFERHQRKPWPKMVSRYDRRVKRYGGKAAHDGTGVGDVVADYSTVRSQAIIMTGNTRKNMFTNHIATVEDRGIVAPMIKWMYNEYKYAARDDLYGSGHPPDSIVAGAMSETAIKTRRGIGFG